MQLKRLLPPWPKSFVGTILSQLACSLALSIGLTSCEFLDELKSFYSTPTTEVVDRPYVILVSIDGYRPDYTNRFNPATLNMIRKKGVSTDEMIPVFPPDTFPDHMSLVTGLYPENHGIVANSFYDPDLKVEFNKNNKRDVENSIFFGGTPLWVASEKAGVRAASLFWPGSEVVIEQTRPSYFYFYDGSVSDRARADQVLTLLDLPDSKRPHFINLYFSTLDSKGHQLGPDSPHLKETVLEMDGVLKRLMDGGKSKGLRINYIFLSGHGMETLDQKAPVFLEDYFDVKSPRLKILGDNAFFSVYSEDQSLLEETLKNLKAKGQHLTAYRRSEIPSALHYSKSKRVGDLVLLASPPHSIYVTRKEHASRLEKKKKSYNGGHGYNPHELKTMRTIFYAIGPNFKQGLKIPEFESIHVYPLVLKILGIPIPKGIDGKESVLADILSDDPHL